jgi:phosphoribosyl-ATP pyrophosphohydrolase
MTIKAMRDSITRLYEAALGGQDDDASTSGTARLLRSGRGKTAKKFGEEATKAATDATSGDRDALILQSTDLIYNLVILWISVGIDPEVVWERMRRSDSHLRSTRHRRKKR